MPRISVVMSVYNAANDLKDSIPGILGQTFRDFEFIIIDDGSTDDTPAVVRKYAAVDPRIKFVQQENRGLTVALNRGLALAQGEYIARQDADDISYPDRFEKQVGLMESDPAIVLVGGNCDDAYENGFTAEWGSYGPKELQKIVFFKTPFAHSTVMMRASTCRKLNGYDESFKTSQDMELWMRFAKAGKLAMVPEPVLRRRIVSSSISVKRRWRQFYDAFRARWRHNKGRRALTVYHSLRSIIIALLPHGVIRAWWQK
jgi:glycosyltransferase involved in cell wall biosynthesis